MSDSELGETPLDQLLAKHRKEKKELQAKVQILKKSKGDKKKKKEVTEEITKLESDLTSRHAQELAELKPLQNSIIMSAGRGGGAGTSRIPRRSITFDSDIAAANLYKEKNIQPPPLYPTLEHKPAPFSSLDTSINLVDVKKKLEKSMRYANTKLQLQSNIDWKLVPSELKIAGTRKRKAGKLTMDKGKDIDWLKKLEERENIKIKEEIEDVDDEERAEKKIKEEVEDEEEGEGEEEVDEDEMMDEGTDYFQNYFDNGEDYIDENDDLDDGPVY